MAQRPASLSQDVSPQCHKYAIPSLCFFAFPPCEPGAPGGRAPEPRSVCRDECELLEHSLCRMEYSIAKRHPLIGQQKILPVCEELAPVGSPESESCLRLGVPHREAEDVNKGGRGRSFFGPVRRPTCGVFKRICPLRAWAPKPDWGELKRFSRQRCHRATSEPRVGVRPASTILR